MYKLWCTYEFYKKIDWEHRKIITDFKQITRVKKIKFTHPRGIKLPSEVARSNESVWFGLEEYRVPSRRLSRRSANLGHNPVSQLGTRTNPRHIQNNQSTFCHWRSYRHQVSSGRVPEPSLFTISPSIFAIVRRKAVCRRVNLLLWTLYTEVSDSVTLFSPYTSHCQQWMSPGAALFCTRKNVSHNVIRTPGGYLQRLPSQDWASRRDGWTDDL